MDGRVAVEQFARAAVDVIGAATQQNGLQAASGVPDVTFENSGQKWYSSRRALAGQWASGGKTAARRLSVGLLISGAMPHVAWPGCLPLRRFMCGLCTVTRAPGDSPAR